ncbi:MAG TPA: Hsp20 family protein [Methylomirabilota bacterium]|nr:Hsp20 family protein [Methylomirabilota bacterium]
MSRLSLSSNPLLLGFEQVDRLLEHIAKQPGDGYPPFNIEQIGENGFRITLAVAGFAPDDLSVQVENNQLVIRGRQPEQQPERVYLYRGIAARQFRRAFVLAEGLDVVSAGLDNGMLAIDVQRPTTIDQVRTIAIRTSDAAGSVGPSSAR